MTREEIQRIADAEITAWDTAFLALPPAEQEAEIRRLETELAERRRRLADAPQPITEKEMMLNFCRAARGKTPATAS